MTEFDLSSDSLALTATVSIRAVDRNLAGHNGDNEPGQERRRNPIIEGEKEIDDLMVETHHQFDRLV